LLEVAASFTIASNDKGKQQSASDRTKNAPINYPHPDENYQLFARGRIEATCWFSAVDGDSPALIARID